MDILPEGDKEKWGVVDPKEEDTKAKQRALEAKKRKKPATKSNSNKKKGVQKKLSQCKKAGPRYMHLH